MQSLFDDLPPPPSNGPYERTTSWRAARDEAMSAVAANAEDATPGFTDRACDFVLAYLAQHGPAPGEQITDECKRAGIVPHDDRAFGGVYMRLAKAGLIRKTGHTIRTKGHGCAGANIWALATDVPEK